MRFRQEIQALPRGAGLRLGEALADARARLAAAGIEGAAADSRALMRHALGLADRAPPLDEDRALAPDELRAFEAAVMRRLVREPVSRIRGRRGFWRRELALGPATLDPRPDTETLVEAALERLAGLRDRPLRLLDLGAGTGAIAIALLDELPAAFAVLVDRAEAAARIARDNLAACGLADRAGVVVGDWGAALTGGFDVVVSNPPYVRGGDIAGLDPDVRDHDPRLALDGGPDGFDAYRAIFADLPRLLAPGGFAVVELGAGQAGEARALAREAGLEVGGVRRDLGGIERALVLVAAAGCRTPGFAG